MVRCRFAPSPTGQLHIGGARTALFNYIFAKKNNGKFILRIEDTDISRSKDQWVSNIINSLKKLDINWDEGPDIGGEYGPYFQSKRKDIYSEYVHKLIEEDKAYYCFCTPEEIEFERKKAEAEKKSFKYSGKCRNLSKDEIKKKIENGCKPSVRIKTEDNGVVVVHDIIRGIVEFKCSEIDDFIILKSDGNPTYNFVCVIDDHLMKISHVIRGEEHLSNTPKQLIVYKALNFDVPQFAHVPMILAPDRSKLSKRHGATSVDEFFEKGYVKDALINYLLLLGWSPGNDRNIVSLTDAIKLFDLSKISKNAAIYDINKLTWLNGYYLKQISEDDLFYQLVPFYKKANINIEEYETNYVKSVINLVKEKVKTLDEIVEASTYFFIDQFQYDEKGVEKYFTNEKIGYLKQIIDQLINIEEFKSESIEICIRKKAEELSIKAAEIIHPLRLALSGRTVTPGLFEMMEILGKERVVFRVNKAISIFS